MSDDELAYLQPGFDLATLTVPRLRSILVSYDIPYPASAKKPQLIQILQDEVLPRSRKILNARARTKRTSRGITDVPSSQEGTVDGDDDEDLMPPPPVPKTPRGRKSKATLAAEAAAQEEAEPATPATSRRTRTPGGRKSTSKHPRQSDTETEPERPNPSVRKTRKSTPGPVPVPVDNAPSVQIQEPLFPVKRERRVNDETSPFSDDNPFQSGSSPSSESRRVSSSTTRTRKSLGSSSSTDRRKSSSQRRQTTSPRAQREQDFEAPSRSTFEFPVSRIKAESEESDGIPVTEEFEPGEELDLARERAVQGYSATDSLPRSKALVRRKNKPASPIARNGLIGTLTVVLATIGAWYRKEKVEVGYCGVGKPAWSLADNAQVPPAVSEALGPVCIPCPQHAYCYPNMEVTCETNYILQSHPLSLGGIVPWFPPTCEPDGEKVKRIKAVADKAVEELRDRRATYECGDEVKTPAPETPNSAVTKSSAPKLQVEENDLKKEVSKLKTKKMSNEEFEDLWESALGDITERDEVEVMRDGSGRLYLSSSSLARLPFGCAIRRQALSTISRNRLPLSALTLISILLAYVRKRVSDYRTASAQIPTLVGATLDRLATQAALAAEGRVSEPFISIGQLRDDVLRATFSASERERVWTGVRAIVEGNSNVRASTREGGRTGEFSRVWEWIGPVNLALEDRRTSGLVERPPSAGVDGDSGLNGSREMAEKRRWDEGRPIY